MSFDSILGPEILNSSFEIVDSETILKNSELILLYFNAMWNEDSNSYLQKLTNFYNECKSNNKGIEIIF